MVDGVTSEILSAYYMIGRGRQFVGMNGAPGPISVGLINEYVLAHETGIPRYEFDRVIFAIDDAFREKWALDQPKPEKK